MWIKDKNTKPKTDEPILIVVGDVAGDNFDYLVAFYGTGFIDDVEVEIFEAYGGEVFEYHEIYAWMNIQSIN